MQQIKHDFVSKVDGLEDYYYVHNAGENTLCVVWLHGHGAHGDQAWTRPDVVEVLHPMINKYKVSLL